LVVSAEKTEAQAARFFSSALSRATNTEENRKRSVMEIVQLNKLKMAQTTLGCLDDNSTVWTGIKGIEEGVATADDLVQQILENSLKQSAATGFAEVKKLAKQTMLKTAFKVCCGLRSLASATGNTQLTAQSDFSRSGLAAGREQDVINRCQSLLDLGNANADALAEKYNVSASDLKALKTAIANFTLAQPKPRKGIAESASATAELVTLFVRLDDVLFNQLDPLVETLQEVNPPFYIAYQTARTIVDSAASRESKPAPAPQPAPNAG
jgi:hypothetical protein